MKTQLDSIRVMIKQSALMATQAACAGENKQDMLVHAAAVQARRAMGGSEMAKIHKMMNMKPDGTGMDMNKIGETSMPADIKLHTALHDAGEAVFDFLDSVGQKNVSCRQAEPASIAAAAAILRESNHGETMSTASKLDQSVTNMLQKQDEALIPAPARMLAQALQQI